MSEGSQSKQETQAPDSQRGVYDRNLLLLVPELVYSTGNVFEHWQLDPRVPERDKEELASRKTVQSFLARFMKSRSESALKILASDDEQARKIEKATQPITTLEYGGKKSGMKLYLGAQYSFFAARYLGDKPAMSVDELLDKMAISKENPLQFHTGHLEKHLQAIPPQTEQQNTQEKPSITPDQVLTQMKSGDFNHSLPSSQDCTVIVSEEMDASKNGYSRTLLPQAKLFRVAAFALICIITGFSFGRYWNARTEDEILNEYREKWEQDGPNAIKTASLKKPPQGSAEIFIRLWETAIDASNDIESATLLANELMTDPEEHYHAKAKYSLGVAHLWRGNAYAAIESFQDAVDILLHLPEEKSVLYNSYLYLSQCHFYADNPQEMLSNLKLASDISAAENRSRLMLLWGWYWIHQGDIVQAEHALEESLRLSLLEGNPSYTGYSHANYALIKISMGDLHEAFRQINLAEDLAIKQNDESLSDLTNAVKLFWSEKMRLPVDTIEQRLKAPSNPANGKYVNTLLDLVRESEK